MDLYPDKGKVNRFTLVKDFIQDYYHPERPHMGLDGDTLIPHHITPLSSAKTKLKAIPILGGLHRRYQRVSA